MSIPARTSMHLYASLLVIVSLSTVIYILCGIFLLVKFKWLVILGAVIVLMYLTSVYILARAEHAMESTGGS